MCGTKIPMPPPPTIARAVARQTGGGVTTESLLNDESAHLVFRLMKTCQVTQGPLSKYKYMVKKKKARNQGEHDADDHSGKGLGHRQNI